MELPPIFLNLKTEEKEYFLSLAKSRAKELAFHKNPGRLWDKDEQWKDWSNVTEHCLMEAARVGALANILGLNNDMWENLISAAVLHDFNKKEEISLTREDIAVGGSGRNGALIAEEKSEKILRDAGFSDIIVSLIRHVTDAHFIKRILDLSNISCDDIAHLIMYYVDNYTRGSRWAESAESRGTIGINDTDRRQEMNTLNPIYEKINNEELALNENHSFFRGMTRCEAAAALNHLIEKRLADIIIKNGVNIGDPLDMPEFVDNCVKNDIKKNSGLF